MTARKVASALTEQGRRELAHFLADNIKDSSLVHLLAGWENDVRFDIRDGQAGHIEISQFHSKTGNPITRTFEGDEIEFEDVEIE